MADNITLSLGSEDGPVIASDDVTAVHYPISKLAHGALDSATLVSTSSGLPVQQQGTWTVGLGAVDNAVLDAIQAAVEAIQAAVEVIDNIVSGNEAQVDVLTIAAGDNNIGNVDLASAIPAGTNVVGKVRLVTATGDEVTEDTGDTVKVSGTVDLGATDNDVLDNIDADLTTIIGHVDGLEALLTTIDADTGAIKTAVEGTLAVSNAGLTELAAAINASSQMDVNIAASGATVPISHAALTELAAAIDTEVQVDIVGALPAGTNAIGKLAANSGVDIGDVDVTSLPALAAGTNAIGKLLPPDVDVTAHTNYAKKYYTSAGAATDGIIWSPAAGKRWHVVHLFINVSAAATVTLEDDLAAGDATVWKAELAANSGIAVTFSEKYPLASGEDAADLLITTSAGNVYVTAVGYEV